MRVQHRYCSGWDETAVHEHDRGSLVGDSPKMTKFRKRKTNRRERREAHTETLRWQAERGPCG